MHRQFFRITFQNPEFLQTLCENIESPLNFANRDRMIKQ